MKNNNKGFKAGDIIEVTVSRERMKISWKLGPHAVTTINNEILNDPSRTFMPYIEMDSTGDIIEWL